MIRQAIQLSTMLELQICLHAREIRALAKMPPAISSLTPAVGLPSQSRITDRHAIYSRLQIALGGTYKISRERTNTKQMRSNQVPSGCQTGTRGRGLMVEFAEKLRHYCRNARCRSKMPAPVQNEKHAFCTPFCYDQHYRRHCVVCECDLPPGPATRSVCKKRSCKAAFHHHPDTYLWPGRAANATKRLPKNANATDVFWAGKSGRGWRWERLPGDDEDWQLFDCWDTLAARIRHDIRNGRNQWWLALPRCFPEKCWDDLETAKARAAEYAVMARPVWRLRPGDNRQAKQSVARNSAQTSTGRLAEPIL
jgi:hypothetical protein